MGAANDRPPGSQARPLHDCGFLGSHPPSPAVAAGGRDGLSRAALDLLARTARRYGTCHGPLRDDPERRRTPPQGAAAHGHRGSHQSDLDHASPIGIDAGRRCPRGVAEPDIARRPLSPRRRREAHRLGHDSERLRPATISEVYPSLFLNGPLPLGSTAGDAAPSNGKRFQWSLSNWAYPVRQHGRRRTRPPCRSTPPSGRASSTCTEGAASGTLLSGLTRIGQHRPARRRSSTCRAARPASGPWRGYIGVGGSVPIPYYLAPSFIVDWTASGQFRFQASGPLSISAGLRFERGRVSPVVSGRSRAQRLARAQRRCHGNQRRSWPAGDSVSRRPHSLTVQVSPTAYAKAGPCRYGDQVAITGGLDSHSRRLSVTRGYKLRGASCAQRTLTITSSGNGSGSVTSRSGWHRLQVPSARSSSTPARRSRLTARRGAGSSFQGWSGGGCSGTAAVHDDAQLRIKRSRRCSLPTPRPATPAPRLASS